MVGNLSGLVGRGVTCTHRATGEPRGGTVVGWFSDTCSFRIVLQGGDRELFDVAYPEQFVEVDAATVECGVGKCREVGRCDGSDGEVQA